MGDLEDKIEGIGLKLDEVKDEVEDNGDGIDGIVDWIYSIYEEYNNNDDYTTSYNNNNDYTTSYDTSSPPLTSDASTEGPSPTTEGKFR